MTVKTRLSPRFSVIISLLLSFISLYPKSTSDPENFIIPDSIIPPAPILKLQTDANVILDSIADFSPAIGESLLWVKLKDFTLDLYNPSVKYPKFIRFCIGAYDWAERVFNTYDKEYVEPFHQHWKVRILNDDWIDSYLMTLPDNMKLHLFSPLYPNIGAYLHFMSFSVGYTYDIKRIHHKPPLDHRKVEFSFNCATFKIESYYHENTGDIILGRFGNIRDHFSPKNSFNGVRLYSYGLDAYYFFNHKRYSHGAAYNFSNRQKLNQGSFITGFSYSNINVLMDFNKFPFDVQEQLKIPVAKYKFHYNSYSLIFGYGYNWVINPRLLVNFTLTPSIGLTHCYEDSLEGGRYMPSMNLSGRSSINYDLGKFFFCGILRFNGHWYKSRTYSLFSSIENFSANIGFRF